MLNKVLCLFSVSVKERGGGGEKQKPIKQFGNQCIVFRTYLPGFWPLSLLLFVWKQRQLRRSVPILQSDQLLTRTVLHQKTSSCWCMLGSPPYESTN